MKFVQIVNMLINPATMHTYCKSLILLVVEEDVGEVELYPEQQVVGELA